MKEIIKEIKDFPNYYISNLGNVYSTKCGKEMTPLEPGLRGGYLSVSLYKDTKTVSKYIHRLVAETFIPNPDNLETVNHRDENKYNNSVNNLEWSSRGDNIRYSACKPVIDLTTKAIYPSALAASRAIQAPDNIVRCSIFSNGGKYRNHKFMYLPRATEDSVNIIEFFGKKFEIPEIFTEEDFVKLFEMN